MDTQILKADSYGDIEMAAKILKDGGIVAVPTETVYGLAANALDETAVRRVFSVKGRPGDNPLIVHISDISELPEIAAEIPATAERLAGVFWPGPLTLIFKKTDAVPDGVSAGLDTVAVRIPEHPAMRSIIECLGRPLAAPSANISGRPSPTSFFHIRKDLFGKVEGIMDGGDCRVGIESTVLSLAEYPPRLLRPGMITREEIERVIGRICVDISCRSERADKAPVSPGMKYTHYSPDTRLTMVDSSASDFVRYVNARPKAAALCFEEDLKNIMNPAVSYGSKYNSIEQAKRLFSSLHEVDELNREEAYVRIPSQRGAGLAVYNRLIRACGFRVVNPCEGYIIGLTGPTGAGKTAVGDVMKELGVAVIDCDEISKRPEVYDADCVRDLQKAFGDDIIKDNVLDRRLLASRAFSNDCSRKRLNEITHPRITRAIKNEILLLRKQGQRNIVLDAPTLFEAGIDSECARIIAVVAEEGVRVGRILKRDMLTYEEAIIRARSQHTEVFFKSHADFVIDTTDGAGLRDKVEEVFSQLD